MSKPDQSILRTRGDQRRQQNASKVTKSHHDAANLAHLASSTDHVSDKLVEDISKVAAVLEEKLSKFSETLDSISTRLERDDRCMEEAECRISTAEEYISTMKSQLARAEKTISMLTQRIEDQENRYRCGNQVSGSSGYERGLRDDSPLPSLNHGSLLYSAWTLRRGLLSWTELTAHWADHSQVTKTSPEQL